MRCRDQCQNRSPRLMLLTIFLLERKNVNRSLDFDHFSLRWRSVKQASVQAIHWWWLPTVSAALSHHESARQGTQHQAGSLTSHLPEQLPPVLTTELLKSATFFSLPLRTSETFHTTSQELISERLSGHAPAASSWPPRITSHSCS